MAHAEQVQEFAAHLPIPDWLVHQGLNKTDVAIHLFIIFA